MPAISVIVPTRDRPAELAAALASLDEQTWHDFEVIVVDNNQRSPAVVADPAWRARDPERWRVVNAPAAATAGQARNAGLAVARGAWVTFLDDDDRYHPDKLARQHALAVATGAPLVLCGFVVALGARRRVKQVARDAFRSDELLLTAVWGTPYLFVRADVAGRFAEDLRAGEDLEFALRLVDRCKLVAVPCVPAPLVEVRPQAGGRSGVNTQLAENWRAQRRALRESGARYGRRARRLFLQRAWLQREKDAGSWSRLLAIACGLLGAGGWGEFRLVANALAYRTGWARRWLVS